MIFDSSLITNQQRLFQNIFALQFWIRVFFAFSLKLAFKNIFKEQDENCGQLSTVD